MSDSRIKILIDNSEYSGWKNFTFRKGLGTLAHQFSFSIPDKWEPLGFPVLFNEGDPVQIFIDDTKISTGYIDDVGINESSKSHGVTVTGRSKTADLVDCSFEGPPYSWKQVKLGELAVTLTAPFNIEVFTTATLPNDLFDFKLKTGESPFEAIDRKAREFGILLGTNVDGNLLFTNNQKQSAKTRLQPGFNIIEYDKTSSLENRFSKYIIKGQDKGRGRKAYSESLGKILGTAVDEGVGRNRPKIIKVSSSTTATIAQKKAAWEAGVRWGKSLSVDIVVADFYQTGFSDLWNINEFVPVKIKNANIDQRMLISDLEFSRSQEGSITTLTCVRPEAFLRDPLPSVRKQRNFVRVAPITDPVPDKNDATIFGGSGKTGSGGFTGSF